MKKKISIGIVLAALLLVVVPTALAQQWNPGDNYWYINASYVSDFVTEPPVIEVNGDSSAGQVFNVGEAVTISVDVYAAAQSCGQYGNGAFTEVKLEVDGPSGADSTADSNYVQSGGCAIADENFSLSIVYDLTTLGTHTVYASSYAAVSQEYTDVADEYIDNGLTFEVVPLEVDIDIKPGSDPNSINCNNKGVISVAILTTEDFDATTVDHTTVNFEGASETHVNKKSGVPRRHEVDVDNDEDTDLVFHFRLGDTGLTCESTEGTLTGEIFDGTRIQGTDLVNIVPKDK